MRRTTTVSARRGPRPCPTPIPSSPRPERRPVTLHVGGRSLPVDLAFAPGASLLLTVSADGAVQTRSA